MHQDSNVDCIPHCQVPGAIGMHMIACTADTRVGYELRLQCSGCRIGCDGIEVDHVVEESARFDELVQRNSLGCCCGGAAIAGGSDFARDCRTHAPDTGNGCAQPLDDGH